MKKIFIALFFQALLAFPLMPQAGEQTDSLAGASSSSSVVLTKAVGDEAYAGGDYARAIAVYEELLATEGEAAEVYYNLGNSYFKQGQLAHAILNYERALLLDPADDDIRFNLELAQSRTVDKITPLSELFFVRWAKDFASLQSSDGWTRWGIASFLLVLGGVALYLFAGPLAVRKVGFFVTLVCVVLCVVANLSASWQKQLRQDARWAIVMSPSVTAKSTPAHSGTDLFVCHEGLKVEIKDNTMTQWKEIRLPDGNVGWVPAEAVAAVAD